MATPKNVPRCDQEGSADSAGRELLGEFACLGCMLMETQPRTIGSKTVCAVCPEIGDAGDGGSG